MSWQAMEWVLKHSRSKGASRLVALAVAYHIDKNGKPAFPSVETIAGFANIRRASVFPCLHDLKDLRELDWIQGGGRNRTNLYTLKLFAPQASLFEDENSQPNGLKAGGKTVRSVRRNSQNYAGKQSEPPDTNRSEPALEPPGKLVAAAQLGDRLGIESKRNGEGDRRLRSFFDSAVKGYGAKFGEVPTWNGKELKNLAALLKRAPAVTSDELQRRFTFFLQSTDRFIVRNGFGLSIFCMRFDALREGPISQQGGTHGGERKGNRKNGAGAVRPEPGRTKPAAAVFSNGNTLTQ